MESDTKLFFSDSNEHNEFVFMEQVSKTISTNTTLFLKPLTAVPIVLTTTTLDPTQFTPATKGNTTKILIGSIVTNINNNCFKGFSSLTEVTFDSTIASLGDSCFETCGNLRIINIENITSSFGTNCFKSCSKLTNITINTLVNQISDGCFSGCSGLSSIDLQNIIFLGNNAFNSCRSLSSVIINNNITIGNSCFFGCFNLNNIDGTKIIGIGNNGFRTCTSLTSYTMSSTLNELPANCFYGCTNLKSCVLNTAVENIYDSCFYQCSNLSSITYSGSNNQSGILYFPPSLTSLHKSCFESCYYDILDGNGVIIGYGGGFIEVEASNSNIWFIGNQAFKQNPFLTYLNLPNTLKVLGGFISDIGEGCFSGCSSLISINDPNKQKIIVPDYVTEIGVSLFSACSSLTEVYLSQNLKRLTKQIFSGCSNLISVNIPDFTEDIGESAFFLCTNISSLTIPVTITSLQTSCFAGCANLTYIEFEDAKNIVFCAADVFAEPAGMGSIIPVDKQTKTITMRFVGFNSPEEFGGPLLNLTTQNPGNPDLNSSYYIYERSSTILYYNGGTISTQSLNLSRQQFSTAQLLLFPSITNVFIPAGVTSISDYFFNGCTLLNNVSIPQGVTYLGKNCFNGCTKLTDIILRSPCEIKKIEENCFQGCAINSFTVPDSVTEFGTGCFSNCINLNNIQFINPLILSIISTNIFLGISQSIKMTFNNLDSEVDIISGSGLDSLVQQNPGNPSLTGLYYVYLLSATKFYLSDGSIVYQSSKDMNFLVTGKTGPELVEVDIGKYITSVSIECFKGCSNLEFIVLPSTINNIKNSAFKNCSKITRISIPSTVTLVGDECFFGCGLLPSSPLPPNVKKYGNYLFSDCSSIQNITIAESVTEIGSNCFANCTSLNSIQFNNILNITVGNDINLNIFNGLTNPITMQFIGVTTNDLTSYIQIYPTSILSQNPSITQPIIIPSTYYVIPTTIYLNNNTQQYIFKTTIANGDIPINATKVILADNTTSLGPGCFSNCSFLTEIIYSTNINTLSFKCFQNCTSLRHFIIKENISNIGNNCFDGCSNLYDITIENPYSLITCGQNIFANISHSITITFGKIPNSNFIEDTSTNNVFLPIIKQFCNQNLTSVLTSNFYIYTGSIFYLNNNSNISIDNLITVTNISNVIDISKLNSVIFSKYVIEFGDSCFQNCTNLTNIFYPENLKKLGNNCFYNCTNFTAFNFPETIENIGNNCFYNCFKLTNFTVPNNIRTIGNNCFEQCNNLNKILLNNPIYFNAVGTNIFLGLNNPIIFEFANISIPTDIPTTILNMVNQNKNDDLYSIYYYYSTKIQYNSGVEIYLSDNTISNINNNLLVSNIKLSSSLSSIPNNCFNGCNILTSIFIDEKSRLKNIGSNAFNSCGLLSSIVVSNNVTSIGNNCFDGCNSLKNILFINPLNLNFVGTNIFLNISQPITFTFYKISGSTDISTSSAIYSLSQQNINTDLTSIYYIYSSKIDYADGTSLYTSEKKITLELLTNKFNIININLASNVTEIGDYCFSDCYQITSINISNTNINKIGLMSFKNCNNMTSLLLPPTLKYIGQQAFQTSKKLLSLIIPSQIISIENFAFDDCPELTTITFNSIQNLTYISESAFRYAHNISNIYFKDITDINEISTYPISNDIRLSIPNKPSLSSNIYIYMKTVITYSDNTTEYIYTNSINRTDITNNINIKSINLSSFVIYLGDSCFLDCNNLENISLSQNITYIGNYCFNNCSKLQYITIPSGITKINEHCFNNCSNLEKITFQGKINQIDNYSFSQCSNLESITILDSVTFIGNNVFEYCNNLQKIIINNANNLLSCGTNLFNGLNKAIYFYFKFYSSFNEITNSILYNFIGQNPENPLLDSKYYIFAINNYYYKDGTKLITRETNITTIPGIIDNLVSMNLNPFATRIAPNLFSNSKINSIIIPNAITFIGNNCFINCFNLSHIQLSESLYEISENCFKNCVYLEIISIPESVTKINNNAFDGCVNLTKIIFQNPLNLNSIGTNLFTNIGHTLNIVFNGVDNSNLINNNQVLLQLIGQNNNVTDLNNLHYEYISSNTNLYLNNGTIITYGKNIDTLDLSLNINSSLITSATIGAYVNKISDDFFKNSNISNIILPYNIKYIGKNCFNGCLSLTSITFKWQENITYIDKTIFDNISSNTITYVYFGNFITKEYLINSQYTELYNNTLNVTNHTFNFILSNVTKIYYYGNITTLDSSITNLESINSNNLFLANKILIGNNIKSITALCFKDTDIINIFIPYSITSLSNECFKNCSKITNIYLDYGITNIGDDCFYGCSLLNNIIIPSSITSIPKNCFNGCTALTNVSSSDYINYIGDNAFYECKNMVTYPNLLNLTYLGESCFYGCSNITSVTLTSNVGVFKNNWFRNCSKLTNINLSNAIIANKSYINTIITGPNDIYNYTLSNYNITNCILPNNITDLIDNLFYNCVSLLEISIPESVTSIYSSCFNGCNGLKNINITNNIKRIDNKAFYECLNLNGVTFSPALSTLTYIGNECFKSCILLTGISLPNSLNFIGDKCFQGCSELRIVNFNQGVLQEIPKDCFNNCLNLYAITLPNNLNIISQYAFKYCISLENISFGNNFTTLNDSCFEDCSNIKELILSDSITEIGDNCFKGCNNITSIYFGQKISKIPENIFKDLNKLREITFHPNSKLTTFSNKMFDGCINLIKVNMPAFVTQIGEYCFNDCISLTELKISSSVSSINQFAFRHCSSLNNIIVDNSLSIKDISRYLYGNIDNNDKTNMVLLPVNITLNNSLYGLYGLYDYYVNPIKINKLNITSTHINTFNISNVLNFIEIIKQTAVWDNKTWVTINDNLPDTNSNTLFYYFIGNNTDKKIYSYPEKTSDDVLATSLSYTSNELNRSYNYNINGINKIIIDKFTLKISLIGSNVTTIGDNCFNGSKLSIVYIPPSGSLLNSIGESAFKDSLIEYIYIPANVTRIGSNCFNGCSNLSTVIFDKNITLTNLPDYCFNKTPLLNFNINNNLYFIGNYCFSESKLQSINLSNTNIQQIGDYAFSSCNYLTSFYLKSDNLTKIGNYVFNSCTKLTSVTIICSINKNCSIGSHLFNSCANLETVNITNNVTSIGSNCFFGCAKINSIFLPNEITKFSNNFFQNLKELTYVSIPLKLTEINDYLFDGCIKLKTINLGSASKIGEYAFQNCTQLKQIAIINIVEEISNNAFKGCSNLTYLSLGQSWSNTKLTNIGTSAFEDCSNLTNIHIFNIEALRICGDNIFKNINKTKTVSFYNINSVTDLINNASIKFVNNLGSNYIPKYFMDTMSNIYTLLKYSQGEPYYTTNNELDLYDVNLIGRTRTNITTALITNPSMTKIAEKCFMSCTLLSEINTFNAATIDNECFKGCANLRNVYVTEALTYIGDMCFENCINLNSINLDRAINLRYIGSKAFSNCKKLTKIILPDTITYLADSTFSGCISLIDINLKNIREYGNNCFETCDLIDFAKSSSVQSNNKSIEFLENIGDKDDTFINQSLICTTNISAGLYKGANLGSAMLNTNFTTYIGEEAFAFSNINHLIISGPSISNLPNRMCKNCTNLVSVYIYSNVTEIGADCFLGCTNLRSIMLPLSLTKIGTNAFTNCSSLTQISLPTYLNNIGNNCFSDCRKLSNVLFGTGIMGDRNYIYTVKSICENLSNLIIYFNKYVEMLDYVNQFYNDNFNIIQYLLKQNIEDNNDLYTLIQTSYNNLVTNCNELKDVTLIEGINPIVTEVVSISTTTTSITNDIDQSVTNITIESSVTTITSDNCFKSTTTITTANNVTSIIVSSSTTNITIPPNTTSILVNLSSNLSLLINSITNIENSINILKLDGEITTINKALISPTQINSILSSISTFVNNFNNFLYIITTRYNLSRVLTSTYPSFFKSPSLALSLRKNIENIQKNLNNYVKFCNNRKLTYIDNSNINVSINDTLNLFVNHCIYNCLVVSGSVLTTLPDSCFKNCKLDEDTCILPINLTSIRNECFYNNNFNTIIPPYVNSIGNKCFSSDNDSNSITELTFNNINNLTNLGTNCFTNGNNRSIYIIFNDILNENQIYSNDIKFKIKSLNNANDLSNTEFYRFNNIQQTSNTILNNNYYNYNYTKELFTRCELYVNNTNYNSIKSLYIKLAKQKYNYNTKEYNSVFVRSKTKLNDLINVTKQQIQSTIKILNGVIVCIKSVYKYINQDTNKVDVTSEFNSSIPFINIEQTRQEMVKTRNALKNAIDDYMAVSNISNDFRNSMGKMFTDSPNMSPEQAAWASLSIALLAVTILIMPFPPINVIVGLITALIQVIIGLGILIEQRVKKDEYERLSKLFPKDLNSYESNFNRINNYTNEYVTKTLELLNSNKLPFDLFNNEQEQYKSTYRDNIIDIEFYHNNYITLINTGIIIDKTKELIDNFNNNSLSTSTNGVNIIVLNNNINNIISLSNNILDNRNNFKRAFISTQQSIIGYKQAIKTSIDQLLGRLVRTKQQDFSSTLSSTLNEALNEAYNASSDLMYCDQQFKESELGFAIDIAFAAISVIDFGFSAKQIKVWWNLSRAQKLGQFYKQLDDVVKFATSAKAWTNFFRGIYSGVKSVANIVFLVPVFKYIGRLISNTKTYTSFKSLILKTFKLSTKILDDIPTEAIKNSDTTVAIIRSDTIISKSKNLISKNLDDIVDAVKVEKSLLQTKRSLLNKFKVAVRKTILASDQPEILTTGIKKSSDIASDIDEQIKLITKNENVLADFKLDEQLLGEIRFNMTMNDIDASPFYKSGKFDKDVFYEGYTREGISTEVTKIRANINRLEGTLNDLNNGLTKLKKQLITAKKLENIDNMVNQKNITTLASDKLDELKGINESFKKIGNNLDEKSFFYNKIQKSLKTISDEQRLSFSKQFLSNIDDKIKLASEAQDLEKLDIYKGLSTKIKSYTEDASILDNLIIATRNDELLLGIEIQNSFQKYVNDFTYLLDDSLKINSGIIPWGKIQFGMVSVVSSLARISQYIKLPTKFIAIQLSRIEEYIFSSESIDDIQNIETFYNRINSLQNIAGQYKKDLENGLSLVKEMITINDPNISDITGSSTLKNQYESSIITENKNITDLNIQLQNLVNDFNDNNNNNYMIRSSILRNINSNYYKILDNITMTINQIFNECMYVSIYAGESKDELIKYGDYNDKKIIYETVISYLFVQSDNFYNDVKTNIKKYWKAKKFEEDFKNIIWYHTLRGKGRFVGSAAPSEDSINAGLSYLQSFIEYIVSRNDSIISEIMPRIYNLNNLIKELSDNLSYLNSLKGLKPLYA